MRVVRQWMIKTFKQALPWRSVSLLAAMATLTSCNPTELTGTNASSKISNNDGSLDGHAFVYLDNPTMRAGKRYGPANPRMQDFLEHTPYLITNNTLLEGECAFFGINTDDVLTPGKENCIVSLSTEDNLQSLPRNADKTYIFPVGSKEFYQVNTLYHLQQGVNKFFSKLEFAYSQLYSGWFNTAPRSIPPYLIDSKMFWFRGLASINPESQLFKMTYLNSFAHCKQDGNASFSPAGPDLCFGGHSSFPGFYFVQDPTIIYHELGHALVSVMMNVRNATDAFSTHPFRSNLGSYGYDEAGSINEGIADYFSFVMNGRAHIGEWALGRTSNQSRPMRENDDLHISELNTTSEGRLSYPQYLLYDPNFPDSPFEDVHYAGQITSHYLVALTDSLRNSCGLTSQVDQGHETATSYVMLVLAETLAELGDLKAKGIDNYGSSMPFSGNVYFNNLDPESSYLWAHFVNPPTYRKFFQVFAKNIYKYISTALCPSFDKNVSEKLLDDYGLLLFKNYNNDGNSTKDRSTTYSDVVGGISDCSPHFPPCAGPTPVNENNRRKSVLVSKQLLSLAERTTETPDAVSYYIIDNATDIKELLQDLLFKGLMIPPSNGVASTDYNNGNIKISPGEIVAIIPNLFNASNSTMAGVQLLATDWDHVDVYDTNNGNFRPCVIDSVTTADQGGETANSCSTNYPDKDHRRLVKDRITKKFPDNAAAPVCLVQLEEEDSTRWVSQNEFRKKQGLALVDKDCLGHTTSGASDEDFSFNPHECLVRFLPGANDAFFSKIDPQKNYFESVVKNSENKEFNTGNVLLMEVNKWIPPGTKFRCRLRARFSNCSDCFNDPSNGNDEYLDYEYNGHKPFQIINFEFDVND